jgi:hypothetical protein
VTQEQQHPITPPNELVQQWMEEAHDQPPGPDVRVIATQAAQWGADQRGTVNEAELQKARDEELGGCCEWLRLRQVTLEDHLADKLRAARRPKPPTRKEALEALERMQDLYPHMGNARTIRFALEALPE